MGRNGFTVSCLARAPSNYWWRRAIILYGRVRIRRPGSCSMFYPLCGKETCILSSKASRWVATYVRPNISTKTWKYACVYISFVYPHMQQVSRILLCVKQEPICPTLSIPLLLKCLVIWASAFRVLPWFSWNILAQEPGAFWKNLYFWTNHMYG